ncbi:class I adenylate-forming enzyme family protein [Cytobacillus pseudoceanisediminis]|uniref:class I adenylate-forming enzyme family protein n=1 Tax=Cytobacillus pseudoceanisediminis TaxID=3051614 RepID=UPI003C30327E
MDINHFLSKMFSHTGIFTVDQENRPIFYDKLSLLIEENREILKTNINENPDLQLIAIDTSMGWRSIPVFLAAIAERITVLPIDSSRNPDFMMKILKEVEPQIIVTALNTSNEGILDLHLSNDQFLDGQSELEDVAMILYTSGTTGNPKGIMLTYHNIFSNLSDILEIFDLNQYDRVYIMRPLTYASAITGELLLALYSGSTIYLKNQSSSIFQSLTEIKKNKITFLSTTPTIANYFSKIKHGSNLHHLRYLVLSGENLNPSIVENLQSIFTNTNICNAYGLTEASPRISCLKEINRKKFELGCVGTRLPSVEIMILDRNRNLVSEGEKGTLFVRGPNIMKGYYKDERLTKLKISNGWLCTHDRAALLDDQLYIYGRDDEVIIRNGVNIHPIEIETALASIEGISDVLAFGRIVNEQTKIYAWVVMDFEIKQSELFKKIIDHVKDSRLMPDVVEIKPYLSKTITGKKFRLREDQ